LISVLNDKSVRTKSILALGKIGGKKAIEGLVTVLTDDSSLGREETAITLEKLGWVPANDVEAAFYRVAIRDWDYCLGVGKLSIEPLVFTLRDGRDNARIGALVTLEKLEWIPGEDDQEAIESAKALQLEVMAIRAKILAQSIEMGVKMELEANLQKLREDQQTTDLNLSEEDFNNLERRFTQDIIKAAAEFEAFRTHLNGVNFKITKSGTRVYVGTETPVGQESTDLNVMTHEMIRSPNGTLQKQIWRNSWTGKPTRELMANRRDLYRYTSDGQRVLLAKYRYQGNGSVQMIEMMGFDGEPREKIFLSSRKIETKIGPEKWIDWPGDIKWASKRIVMSSIRR